MKCVAEEITAEETIEINAIICKGHRAASGLGSGEKPGEDKTFGGTCEGGSIQAQYNVFLKDENFKKFNDKHFNGKPLCPGSLNCYIGTHQDKIDPLTYMENSGYCGQDREVDLDEIKWDYKFPNIKWHDNFAPEDFYLLAGKLIFKDETYSCLFYCVDPATKKQHPIPKTIIEIIAPKIPFDEKSYNQKVVLRFPKESFKFKKVEPVAYPYLTHRI